MTWRPGDASKKGYELAGFPQQRMEKKSTRASGARVCTHEESSWSSLRTEAGGEGAALPLPRRAGASRNVSAPMGIGEER